MKIELLKEPFLEFGNDFISDDPKLGLSVGGFFSTSNNTHRSEIHFSVIGTNTIIEETIEYIKCFESIIEAKDEEIVIEGDEPTIVDGEVINELDENTDEFTPYSFKSIFSIEPLAKEEEPEITKNKRLNPDFVGFSGSSILQCSFKNDPANNVIIRESDLRKISESRSSKQYEKAVSFAELYIEAYEKLINTSISKPAICFITLPSSVYKISSSVPLGAGRYFNFRRYLKARLIGLKDSIPVQILLEDTILQKKKGIQDLSMQAWNFCVANYYKNNCTPWVLSLSERNTCFIGISFHRVLSEVGNLIKASIAQAFNYEGKGIIFVGKRFKWDDKANQTKAPHLTYEYAKSLIVDVIKEYQKYNDILPNRVVVHKTTDFWNSASHPDYSEVEGLKDGINELLGNKVTIDLVTIKAADFKLLRTQGRYPVIRGTFLQLDKATGILYTTGYIPIYETFPGVHIPRPIEISIYEGETSLKKVSQEILALTKLNFNNCNYYDSLPITLRFAQKVGEIIQYMEEDSLPPNKYYFYM